MTPLLHAVTTILIPDRNKPLDLPGKINGEVKLLFTVDTGIEVSTALLRRLRGKINLTGVVPKTAYGAGGHAIYLRIRLGPWTVLEASVWLGEVNAFLSLGVLASRKVCIEFKKDDNIHAVGYPNVKLALEAVGYPPCLVTGQTMVVAVEMKASTASLHARDRETAIQVAENTMVQRIEPLQNPDRVLYTDGSSTCEDGRRRANWAVTAGTDVIPSDPGLVAATVQKARFKALIEGLRAVADWADPWKQRDFLTTTGTPIKNAELMLNVAALSKEVAVVKTKAHGPLNTPEALRSPLADTTTRETSKLSPPQVAAVKTPYRTEILKDIGVMQKGPDRMEIWTWIGSGAKLLRENKHLRLVLERYHPP